MSPERSWEVLDQIGTASKETDENNELMLDFYQHRLIPGTSAFKKAKQLANDREKMNEDVVIE